MNPQPISAAGFLCVNEVNEYVTPRGATECLTRQGIAY